MLKKTIKFTDYDNVEREEVFYFNLTKAELMEWEFSEKGGLKSKIEQIIAAKDVPSLASLFKDIIVKAYGVKSPDGRKFIKNQEVLDDFMQSEAYSTLYMELATDENAAKNFIESVIPTVNT